MKVSPSATRAKPSDIKLSYRFGKSPPACGRSTVQGLLGLSNYVSAVTIFVLPQLRKMPPRFLRWRAANTTMTALKGQFAFIPHTNQPISVLMTIFKAISCNSIRGSVNSSNRLTRENRSNHPKVDKNKSFHGPPHIFVKAGTEIRQRFVSHGPYDNAKCRDTQDWSYRKEE